MFLEIPSDLSINRRNAVECLDTYCIECWYVLMDINQSFLSSRLELHFLLSEDSEDCLLLPPPVNSVDTFATEF